MDQALHDEWHRGASILCKREGLHDVGFVEGQNLTVEYRSADGHEERLPDLVSDLVRRKVWALVTIGGDLRKSEGVLIMNSVASAGVRIREGKHMKKLLVTASVISFGVLAGVAVARAADVPMPWAYGFLTPPPSQPAGAPTAAPNPPAPPDNVTKLTIPGSTLSFTRSQLADRYGPADWFPQEHSPMPEIVAHGRQSANPTIFACSLCHQTNGKGRPENAGVAGLPYNYIVQQLTEFRNGNRKTSDSRKTNTGTMSGFARAMTDEEIKQAATWFSSTPFTPWVKVVESPTVPKARPAAGLFLKLEGAEAGEEPIGDRILEIPVDGHETEYLRNPHSGYIAYVPPGSLKKGEALVQNGMTAAGGKVTACTACHGPDLRGLGPVPPLAGRSPSYIARQLYDMQHGNRNGAWTALMAPVVSKLNPEDLLTSAAYIASLQP